MQSGAIMHSRLSGEHPSTDRESTAPVICMCWLRPRSSRTLHDWLDVFVKPGRGDADSGIRHKGRPGVNWDKSRDTMAWRFKGSLHSRGRPPGQDEATGEGWPRSQKTSVSRGIRRLVNPAYRAISGATNRANSGSTNRQKCFCHGGLALT